MSRSRMSGLWTLALTLLALPAFGQAYGTGQQTLTIGAEEFRPFESTCTYNLNGDGYLFSNCEMFAPVHLPDGAHITQICIYAFDPDATSGAQVTLESVLMPAGGQSPGTQTVPESFVSANFDIGYGNACSGPMDYVVLSFANSERQRHHLAALTFLNGKLGGAIINWNRQVSPSPAAATFGDVPTGHAQFQFVEALVASGITAGCGGGNYCPGSPLTRGQMAVFLAKALGLHWTN